ncbi:receptor-type tyrosine-protein phosphatase alpha-like isoform X2 [Anneissia japonica]|uniref:receptor-type tyrosine-protein phosphatase alpha-like isoform X2 n=1 Tax=Anneissia japonica TaxID=1529436 RepID=UPI0014256226|nr:receptor-type tyrosine-protein phosphatase alpha-like isoform X2 [Anneissia japonica]
MLDMMEVEASVDILGYLKQIRGDRVDMVQTVHQCVCIYNALLEFHLKSVVQFPLSEFSSRIAHLKRLNPVTKTTFIEEEFQMLNAITPSPGAEAMPSGCQQHNIKKNLFANVSQVDRSRVILNFESNNYINASFVNMPLTETVDDFWRLVHDWKATAIVVLNSIDLTCAQYWQENEGSTKHVGNMKIQLNSYESRGDHIIIRKFFINDEVDEKREPLAVTQYQVTDWPVGQDSPNRLETLLEVYEIVESNLDVQKGHPVVVHCMNGMGRTGVYCAITETLDRIKHDGVVDVFQSVKRLRANRPGLVENIEQYTHCYDLVGAYIQRTVLKLDDD